MPVTRCQIDGAEGWKWGESGHCYTGPDAKQRAIEQGLAMGELPGASKALQTVALKLDSSRREATGVFVKPFDGTAKSLDLDGEAVTLDDVYRMARLFMEQGRISGHDDQHDRASEVGTLVEIFVNDERIASPHYPAGAGVCTMKYTPEEWALVVSGQRTGFSYDVGVFAEVELVELLVPPSAVRKAARKGPPSDGAGEVDSVPNPLVAASEQSAGRWRRLQRRFKAAGDELQPEQVAVADLRTLQPEVELDKVRQFMADGEALAQPVQVVEDDGELVLIDGNHRAAAWHESGAETVPALVVRQAQR